MKTLAELAATLLALEPMLRAVPVTYWSPKVAGEDEAWDHRREESQRRAGKWEVDVRGDYAIRYAFGLGDTPEAAVQDAIDWVLGRRRAAAERREQEATQAREERDAALRLAAGEK